MSLVTHYMELQWTKTNKDYYIERGYIFTNIGDTLKVAQQHLLGNVKSKSQPIFYLTKWIGKHTYNNHFIQKGYTFTKANDEFLVRPMDLLPASRVEILCICDLCYKVFMCPYYLHYQRANNNNADVCKNCTIQKECNFIEYLTDLKCAYDDGLFFIENDVVKVKDRSGYKETSPNKNNQIYFPLLNKRRISKEIIEFVCNLNDKEITEELLAEYWYNGQLPTVKMNGFWTLRQCKECLKIIKKNGGGLSPKKVRKDLYTAIAHIMPYFDFLIYCGEDPVDSYYDLNKEDKTLLGIYVEHSIISIIKQHSDNFIFQQKNKGNRFDIVNNVNKSINEIKLSIHTKIDKEKEKYKGYDLSITFLIGDEDFYKITPEQFKFMSIFKWISINEKYFTDMDNLIKKVRELKLKLMDSEVAYKEVRNYYSLLCLKIFSDSNKGMSQMKIANELGLSRRQVGRILNQQTLKPYVDNESSIEYRKKVNQEKEKREQRNNYIIDLHNKGIDVKEIRERVRKLYGELSAERIVQIINKSKGVIKENKGNIVAINLEGKVLGTFTSTVQAAQKLNLPNYRNICTVLRNEIPHYRGIVFKRDSWD